MRQALHGFRRAYPQARVGAKAPFTREIAIETAPRRQHARNGTAIEPARVQLRDVAAYLMHLQGVERAGAGELYQRRDIARVARGRIGCQAALVCEMREKICQVLLGRRSRRGSARGRFRCGCRGGHARRHTKCRASAAATISPSRDRKMVPISG